MKFWLLFLDKVISPSKNLQNVVPYLNSERQLKFWKIRFRWKFIQLELFDKIEDHILMNCYCLGWFTMKKAILFSFS